MMVGETAELIASKKSYSAHADCDLGPGGEAGLRLVGLIRLRSSLRRLPGHPDGDGDALSLLRTATSRYVIHIDLATWLN
jgi:hypothetical protein